MIWSRLKNNKCPQCNSILDSSIDSFDIWCSSQSCSFSIRKAKFELIVGDLYKKRPYVNDHDNTSDLNNYDFKAKPDHQ